MAQHNAVLNEKRNAVLAAVQMVSTPNVEENLKTAAAWVKEAVRQGAEVILLPEFFSVFTADNHVRLELRETFGRGRVQEFLQNLATTYKVWLFCGSIPLRAPDDENRVFNAMLVYNPDGECVARYDKVHLFSYQKEQERYDEANAIVPGKKLVTVDTPFGKVGLAICYDLRFPELFRALSESDPVDLIVLPAAFTQTTGRAHWETLLRARAIENQCYLLASAQGGDHPNKRHTFGHSMLVDPWGEILDCKHKGEGLALGILDHARIAEVRRILPALSQRTLFVTRENNV